MEEVVDTNDNKKEVEEEIDTKDSNKEEKEIIITAKIVKYCDVCTFPVEYCEISHGLDKKLIIAETNPEEEQKEDSKDGKENTDKKDKKERKRKRKAISSCNYKS